MMLTLTMRNKTIEHDTDTKIIHNAKNNNNKQFKYLK